MRFYPTSGTIGAITTIGNEYNTFVPEVRLCLRENFSYNRANAETIKGLFSDLNAQIHRYGPSRDNPQFGIGIEGNVLRQVVDRLFQRELIDAGHRAAIEADVRKFEQSIERRSLVSTETTAAQLDAMETIIGPYIEGIVNEVNEPGLLVKLLKLALCDIPIASDNVETLINFRLNIFGMKEETYQTITDSSKREELFGCIYQVWRIYSGTEGLKDTLLRLGSNLPTEKAQQELIARVLFKALNEKIRQQPEIYTQIDEMARDLLNHKSLPLNIAELLENPVVATELVQPEEAPPVSSAQTDAPALAVPTESEAEATSEAPEQADHSSTATEQQEIEAEALPATSQQSNGAAPANPRESVAYTPSRRRNRDDDSDADDEDNSDSLKHVQKRPRC